MLRVNAAALLLASCATPAAPGGRCVRVGVALDLRALVNITPDGEARPVAQLGARPVCTKRETAR